MFRVEVDSTMRLNGSLGLGGSMLFLAIVAGVGFAWYKRSH